MSAPSPSFLPHPTNATSQEPPQTGSALTLRSRSADETRRLGDLLGRVLAAGDVVLLSGALGAGKTAFTQGIAVGLGVRVTVNSPTFTLLKEYAGRLPLYHFDLYRIDNADEVLSLGFAEYFEGNGVSVIEWAERAEVAGDNDAGSPWPESWLRINLRATGRQSRELTITAHGARGAELVAAFAQATARRNAPRDATSGADARNANGSASGEDTPPC
ncbi:MAG: tRNA (adenosine(37)-N6)-threonylcarbamoyltransferase complex ATPase subunit type 1 TsaE [Ktedonobacterales bacterium]